MNTIHKLLKITGSIGLSCVCLTAEAEPETMTLEEVKAFLEAQKKKLRNGFNGSKGKSKKLTR